MATENTENNNSGRVGLGPPIKAENPIRNMYGVPRYQLIHANYSHANAIRTENIIRNSVIDLMPASFGIHVNGTLTKADYMRPYGYKIEDPPPPAPWIPQ